MIMTYLEYERSVASKNLSGYDDSWAEDHVHLRGKTPCFSGVMTESQFNGVRDAWKDMVKRGDWTSSDEKKLDAMQKKIPSLKTRCIIRCTHDEDLACVVALKGTKETITFTKPELKITKQEAKRPYRISYLIDYSSSGARYSDVGYEYHEDIASAKKAVVDIEKRVRNSERLTPWIPDAMGRDTGDYFKALTIDRVPASYTIEHVKKEFKSPSIKVAMFGTE